MSVCVESMLMRNRAIDKAFHAFSDMYKISVPSECKAKEKTTIESNIYICICIVFNAFADINKYHRSF